MFNEIDWLNKHAELVLIAITGFYAWRTHAMSKTMEKQIVADINIMDATLLSSLSNKEVVDGLINHITAYNDPTFILDLKVRNASSAAGSITDPKLEICFGNCKLVPVCTSCSEPTVKGGEICNLHMEYVWLLRNNYDKELESLKVLERNFTNVKYIVSYTNNIGRKHSINVKDVYSHNQKDIASNKELDGTTR